MTVEQLLGVVDRTLDEKRSADALRAEIKRALGSSVVTEGSLERVAEQANLRLETLERTGRLSRCNFSPVVAACYTKHSSDELRKLAARVAPLSSLRSMHNDASPGVRAILARRIPLNAVSEMLKKHPYDDQVRVTYKKRCIAEVVKQPEPDEPLDIYGDAPMGDSAKQKGVELSDQWYDTLANRFMQDYSANIEDGWEEVSVKRYVSSVRATSGVELDAKKLYKLIKSRLVSREDAAITESKLKNSVLRKTAEWLRSLH